MTLHDRLLALADEGDAKAWALNRHALALAAARMALDDAAEVAMDMPARKTFGHSIPKLAAAWSTAAAIRALRSQLDQSEG